MSIALNIVKTHLPCRYVDDRGWRCGFHAKYDARDNAATYGHICFTHYSELNEQEKKDYELRN